MQPRVREYVPAVRPALFRPAPPTGMWARLRRGILGLPKPLFEE